MTTIPYTLHYAPDNASLIVRLALEELGQPYRTVLVDRRANAQKSADYLALNPNGLIPVLETRQGPVFETAAILLWLVDEHKSLGPSTNDPLRADFLKWLFFLSNTLHPALRCMFYADKYIGEATTDQEQLRHVTRQIIEKNLRVLEARWQDARPLVLDLYLAPMLRWLALYPKDTQRDWFNISDYPMLCASASQLEARPSVLSASRTEGLGPRPFTAPQPPNPPEGSAL